MLGTRRVAAATGESRTDRRQECRTDRREDCRAEVFLKTIVTHGRNELVPAELVNLSCAGFLIRIKPRFRKSSHIQIALPKLGYIPSKVIWSLQGCAGCLFVNPLEEHDFNTMLRAIRHAKPGWLETLPKR